MPCYEKADADADTLQLGLTANDIVDYIVGKRRAAMRRRDSGEADRLELGGSKLGDEISAIQSALHLSISLHHAGADPPRFVVAHHAVTDQVDLLARVTLANEIFENRSAILDRRGGGHTADEDVHPVGFEHLANTPPMGYLQAGT
jgi:hypothetical protein